MSTATKSGARRLTDWGGLLESVHTHTHVHLHRAGDSRDKHAYVHAQGFIAKLPTLKSQHRECCTVWRGHISGKAVYMYVPSRSGHTYIGVPTHIQSLDELSWKELIECLCTDAPFPCWVDPGLRYLREEAVSVGDR